jgi:steroid 5-alpha reductase family enzyme
MPLLATVLTVVLAPLAGLSAVSWGNPLQFLVAGDLLVVLAVVMASYAAASFLIALVNGDCSQTDRLWSVAPVVYAWIILVRHPADPRLLAMAVLVTLWGARLTFNFARRGGYTDMEDYRWEALRKRITNPILWQLFNLFFIAVFQHVLILAFVLPMYAASLAYPGFGWLDMAACALFLLTLAMETTADQQMWNFQERKRTARAAGRPAPEGNFITSGLWSLSRHPNLFFESSNWWVFYLFAVAATGRLLDWTLAGAILLTILLQGSIAFTESISMRRYPEYAEHRQRVSAFLPLPRRFPVAKRVDG